MGKFSSIAEANNEYHYQRNMIIAYESLINALEHAYSSLDDLSNKIYNMKGDFTKGYKSNGQTKKYIENEFISLRDKLCAIMDEIAGIESQASTNKIRHIELKTEAANAMYEFYDD